MSDIDDFQAQNYNIPEDDIGKKIERENTTKKDSLWALKYEGMYKYEKQYQKHNYYNLLHFFKVR